MRSTVLVSSQARPSSSYCMLDSSLSDASISLLLNAARNPNELFLPLSTRENILDVSWCVAFGVVLNFLRLMELISFRLWCYSCSILLSPTAIPFEGHTIEELGLLPKYIT